jgi:GNAT superfamily N-acetyltransferase
VTTALQIAPLADGAAAFARLTFPAYRSLLDERHVDRLALGARHDGAPVALSLWRRGDVHWRLLSLAVRPDQRRRGIGRRLLAASDAEIGPSGKHAYWSGALPAAIAFEALLGQAGWSGKTLEAYRCALTPAQVERWASRRTLGKVGDRIGTFSWSAWETLSSADHAEIAALEASPDCPPGFTPSAFLARNELWLAHASVLRCRGVPVGWCLTRRAGGDVWYENFWTRPEHVRSGAQIAMLLAIIRRQGELLGPDSVGRFVTSEERPGMLALTRGQFQGCLTFKDEHWQASKA